VNRREQIVRFGEAALVAAEPGQVCGSAQFERSGFLTLRDL